MIWVFLDLNGFSVRPYLLRLSTVICPSTPLVSLTLIAIHSCVTSLLCKALSREPLSMKANYVDGLSQLEPVLNWNLLFSPIPSWNVDPGVNRLKRSAISVTIFNITLLILYLIDLIYYIICCKKNRWAGHQESLNSSIFNVIVCLFIASGVRQSPLTLFLCLRLSDSNLRLFVNRDGTTALSGIRLGNRWETWPQLPVSVSLPFSPLLLVPVLHLSLPLFADFSFKL